MMSRRHFLAGSSSLIVSTPAIVRAGSLMRCRGIYLPIERNYFGFVCRLYVSLQFPPIEALQAKGLNAHEIASRLSREHGSTMIGKPWDADVVMNVVRRTELIRREDQIIKQERAREALLTC